MSNMMQVMTYVGIVACILLETFEQIAFKISGESPKKNRIFTSAGIVCYVLHMAVWFWVLSVIPLGIALPLMGATYITVALVSRFLFKECIQPRRWAGIALILAGLCCVWKVVA